MEPRKKPVIAVVGCGGTISTIGLHSTDTTNYRSGKKLTAGELLEIFPQALDHARILTFDLGSLGSSAFGPPEWAALRSLIISIRAAHQEVSGFVVLHGTATMEETAFFLHIALNMQYPVICVGSQRPVSAVSSDAGMNFISAVRVAAASPQLKGTYLVMNDEIHSARDVVKTSAHRLHTMQSPGFGPIGQVDGDGVMIYRNMLRPSGTFSAIVDNADLSKFPRIEITYSYAGSDGALIDAAVSAGAKGIVSAGLAPGVGTPGEIEAFRRATSNGVVIVQASRAVSGRVVDSRYISSNNLVPAQTLSPQKARIVLGLSILNRDSVDVMRDNFSKI